MRKEKKSISIKRKRRQKKSKTDQRTTKKKREKKRKTRMKNIIIAMTIHITKQKTDSIKNQKEKKKDIIKIRAS
jgi:hypothetical protein